LSGIIESSKKIGQNYAVTTDALEKNAESMKGSLFEFGDELKRVLGLDLLD
jgi:hypothetical protein